MSELVRISRTGAACELRLDRPDKRNALTRAMYDALVAALAAAEADAAIRVVLLSGEGASFTAGNDMHDFLDTASIGPEHGAVRFMRSLAGFSKVLLAAVHGQTVGIGVTLLLHCDLVVAARSTQLSMPFVRLGLVPEAGSSLLLPRLVGQQRAAELLLLGRPLSAQEALELGLVNKVVEDEILMAEARALAETVCRQPPGALRAAKRLLRSGSSTVNERIDEELSAFKERLASEEFSSAAQQFLRKSRS